MTTKSTRPVSALGLRSLRTFEAAARHLHFTRAAEELCVTTAAISHQVRELEAQLGLPLFSRQGRTVRLTAEGEVMRQSVVEAITALERGIARLGVRRQADQVRVSAAPSVAAKWLVPRLERFLEKFPAADIRVDVSFVETEFSREPADLSIRHGEMPKGDALVDRLFVESVFPVCSPRLLGRRGFLRSPQDLLRYKLIHVDWAAPRGHWPTWKSWMHAAQVKDVGRIGGIHFQQTSLAIEAAIAGQGIALGEASLVAQDLASGRLIKPLLTDVAVQAEGAYHLVTRQESLAVPLVREFRQWLLDEARQPVSTDVGSALRESR